jgi:hypothetical protein
LPRHQTFALPQPFYVRHDQNLANPAEELVDCR